MKEKKSFYEIITNKLKGKWCDGLAILDISDDIQIGNIYDNNEKNIPINDYAISIKEKIFSQVVEKNYEEAITEFNVNNRSIISPKVSTDQIVTFDGCKWIEYGGNVYSHTLDNKIIVNDKHKFDSFDEISGMGFISDKEIKGKWLVF
ncbi:hypothetical protein [Clostridium botulinum]|uniref:hypothetical protein n=1 Tax=Clostridium botulinum TaxID=1491 RepID=UPI003DA59420